MPKSGVMRLAISTESSVSRVPPSSGVTMLETVGSESSSATNGSSVESDAGKKRLQAKPCERALSVERKRAVRNASASGGTRKKIEIKIERRKDILIF